MKNNDDDFKREREALKDLFDTIYNVVDKHIERKKLDREEWINLFKNNSKEEILELLIDHKFPL
jgi:hypothetical protein